MEHFSATKLGLAGLDAPFDDLHTPLSKDGEYLN